MKTSGEDQGAEVVYKSQGLLLAPGALGTRRLRPAHCFDSSVDVRVTFKTRRVLFPKSVSVRMAREHFYLEKNEHRKAR